MTIQEAIRKMAAAGTEPYCKVCTVDAVDEDARTVDCTRSTRVRRSWA